MTSSPDKASIRSRLLSQRKALDAENRKTLSAAICERLLSCIYTIRDARILALYFPTQNEVDVLPLRNDPGVRDDDWAICLPVISENSKILSFHLWQKNASLEKGPYGIMQPLLTASQWQPDIVLVPLVAFDRQGGRVGYGQGYYDNTLRALRKQKHITAIGVAYGFQEVAVIPQESFDETLDMIVTENETIALT